MALVTEAAVRTASKGEAIFGNPPRPKMSEWTVTAGHGHSPEGAAPLLAWGTHPPAITGGTGAPVTAEHGHSPERAAALLAWGTVRPAVTGGAGAPVTAEYGHSPGSGGGGTPSGLGGGGGSRGGGAPPGRSPGAAPWKPPAKWSGDPDALPPPHKRAAAVIIKTCALPSEDWGRVHLNPGDLVLPDNVLEPVLWEPRAGVYLPLLARNLVARIPVQVFPPGLGEQAAAALPPDAPPPYFAGLAGALGTVIIGRKAFRGAPGPRGRGTAAAAVNAALTSLVLRPVPRGLLLRARDRGVPEMAALAVSMGWPLDRPPYGPALGAGGGPPAAGGGGGPAAGGGGGPPPAGGSGGPPAGGGDGGAAPAARGAAHAGVISPTYAPLPTQARLPYPLAKNAMYGTSAPRIMHTKAARGYVVVSTLFPDLCAAPGGAFYLQPGSPVIDTSMLVNSPGALAVKVTVSGGKLAHAGRWLADMPPDVGAGPFALIFLRHRTAPPTMAVFLARDGMVAEDSLWVPPGTPVESVVGIQERAYGRSLVHGKWQPEVIYPVLSESAPLAVEAGPRFYGKARTNPGGRYLKFRFKSYPLGLYRTLAAHEPGGLSVEIGADWPDPLTLVSAGWIYHFRGLGIHDIEDVAAAVAADGDIGRLGADYYRSERGGEHSEAYRAALSRGLFLPRVACAASWPDSGARKSKRLLGPLEGNPPRLPFQGDSGAQSALFPEMAMGPDGLRLSPETPPLWMPEPPSTGTRCHAVAVEVAGGRLRLGSLLAEQCPRVEAPPGAYALNMAASGRHGTKWAVFLTKGGVVAASSLWVPDGTPIKALRDLGGEFYGPPGGTDYLVEAGQGAYALPPNQAVGPGAPHYIGRAPGYMNVVARYPTGGALYRNLRAREGARLGLVLGTGPLLTFTAGPWAYEFFADSEGLEKALEAHTGLAPSALRDALYFSPPPQAVDLEAHVAAALGEGAARRRAGVQGGGRAPGPRGRAPLAPAHPPLFYGGRGADEALATARACLAAGLFVAPPAPPEEGGRVNTVALAPLPPAEGGGEPERLPYSVIRRFHPPVWAEKTALLSALFPNLRGRAVGPGVIFWPVPGGPAIAVPELGTAPALGTLEVKVDEAGLRLPGSPPVPLPGGTGGLYALVILYLPSRGAGGTLALFLGQEGEVALGSLWVPPRTPIAGLWARRHWAFGPIPGAPHSHFPVPEGRRCLHPAALDLGLRLAPVPHYISPRASRLDVVCWDRDPARLYGTIPAAIRGELRMTDSPPLGLLMAHPSGPVYHFSFPDAAGLGAVVALHSNEGGGGIGAAGGRPRGPAIGATGGRPLDKTWAVPTDHPPKPPLLGPLGPGEAPPRAVDPGSTVISALRNDAGLEGPVLVMGRVRIDLGGMHPPPSVATVGVEVQSGTLVCGDMVARLHTGGVPPGAYDLAVMNLEKRKLAVFLARDGRVVEGTLHVPRGTLVDDLWECRAWAFGGAAPFEIGAPGGLYYVRGEVLMGGPRICGSAGGIYEKVGYHADPLVLYRALRDHAGPGLAMAPLTQVMIEMGRLQFQEGGWSYRMAGLTAGGLGTVVGLHAGLGQESLAADFYLAKSLGPIPPHIPADDLEHAIGLVAGDLGYAAYLYGAAGYAARYAATLLAGLRAGLFRGGAPAPPS
jgi:hypothetical protein